MNKQKVAPDLEHPYKFSIIQLQEPLVKPGSF